MPKSGASFFYIAATFVCDVDIIPERADMRTGSFASIWLLALFSVVKVNPSVAYDLRTSPEKSLYTNAAYPYFIRIVFRFYGYAVDDLNVIDTQSFQRALATYASVNDASDSEDVIEINSLEEFNPAGNKGGKGASTNVDIRIYSKSIEHAQSVKLQLDKIRKSPTAIENIFKQEVQNMAGNTTRTVPSDFYIYVKYQGEIIANQPRTRNYWYLFASSIVSSLIGALVVTSQAFRRYDFDPLQAPTKTVDTGKYEYVIDTENEESKGQ